MLKVRKITVLCFVTLTSDTKQNKTVTVPGVPTMPTFAIRLRSSDAHDTMDEVTVTVVGANAVLASVDTVAQIVFVNITHLPSVPMIVSFNVTAALRQINGTAWDDATKAEHIAGIRARVVDAAVLFLPSRRAGQAGVKKFGDDLDLVKYITQTYASQDGRVVQDLISLILSTPAMVLVKDSGVLSSTEAWIELYATTRKDTLEFLKLRQDFSRL